MLDIVMVNVLYSTCTKITKSFLCFPTRFCSVSHKLLDTYLDINYKSLIASKKEITILRHGSDIIGRCTNC